MDGYSNSERQRYKEDEALSLFLDAYGFVAGCNFNNIKKSERPDYVCEMTDGSQMGIELVEVRRGHPNGIIYDRIIEKREYMTIDQAIDELDRVAVQKEEKRKSDGWNLRDNTILLVELTDIPLVDIKQCITFVLVPGLFLTGFSEVWLVDYTGLDAFGDVELFCVQPQKLAGYYPRPMQKPYG